MKFFLEVGEFKQPTGKQLYYATVKVFSEQEEDFGDSRVCVQRHIATGFVCAKENEHRELLAIKAGIEGFKESLCDELMKARVVMKKQTYSRTQKMVQDPLSGAQ